MSERLKTRNPRISTFKDRPNAGAYPFSGGFSRASGTTTSVTKGNEKERLVRCKHCGWICDRERDVRLEDGVWAGFGINQGEELFSDGAASNQGGWGDSWGLLEWGGNTIVDSYYDRDVRGGCPSCGSYLYDPKQPNKYSTANGR